jgi:hypothetical protein
MKSQHAIAAKMNNQHILRIMTRTGSDLGSVGET